MPIQVSGKSRIEVGGIILAGGQSRRMGRNKALLRAGIGSPLMIELVVARLKMTLLTDPILVTNTPDEYTFLGLDLVPDYCLGTGPMSGIVAGLNTSAYDLNIIVGCDMPLLNSRLLNYMVDLSPEYEAVVPVFEGEDHREQWQVLHAVYSKTCADSLRFSLDQGNLSLRKAVERLNIRKVDKDEILAMDPGLLSFKNINTNADWASYMSLLNGLCGIDVPVESSLPG